MKASELIKLLQEIPPDTEVLVDGYEDGLSPIMSVGLQTVALEPNLNAWSGIFDTSDEEHAKLHMVIRRPDSDINQLLIEVIQELKKNKLSYSITSGNNYIQFYIKCLDGVTGITQVALKIDHRGETYVTYNNNHSGGDTYRYKNNIIPSIIDNILVRLRGFF
jgi:hypothetical protein